MIPEKYRTNVLARTISEIDDRPSSVQEVAVLLEALGFLRADEPEHSKFIQIAELVWRLVPHYSGRSMNSIQRRSRHTVRRSLRAFASGIAYSTMWSIMLTVLFVGGISLWAAYPELVGSLSPGVAFSIGLGVLISFLATGGTQQAFSHRISYYRLQNNLPLAKTEAKRGYIVGFISILIAALTFLFAMAVTAASVELAYTVLFLALLGSYLILVIPLYAYRKFHLIAVGLIIALTCLYSIFYSLNFSRLATADYNVVISQLVGLVALNGITAVECIMVVFLPSKRANSPYSLESNGPTSSGDVRAPKFSIILLEIVPLFVFGTMFYLILFLDRLVGWTTMGVPFLLTYSTSYPFGSDIALLVLILPTGIICYFSDGFYDALESESCATAIRNREHLKSLLRRIATKMFVSVGVVAIASALVLWQYAPLILRISDQETLLVFGLSLAAYSSLALLLANTFISLSFRRYMAPAFFFIVAVLADIGTNIFFPRFILGWNHAFGLLTGLILATIIATSGTTRLIKSAHYFYYSAF